MSKIQLTLRARGEVYGDYASYVEVRNQILELLDGRHRMMHGKDIPDEFKGYLLDVVGKLVRLSATPEHTDSWHDLSGYSLLVEEILIKRNEENKTKSLFEKEENF